MNARRSWLAAVLGLSLAIGAGCGKKSEADAADKSGADESAAGDLDPGKEFLLESAQKRVEEIKATISKSDFDPKYACAAVKTALAELASVKHPKVDAFRPEAEKLCGLEAWVAYANLILPKIEAARAKDPNLPASDCAHFGIALEEIDGAHAAEPRVAELQKKKGELCP